MRKDRCLLIFLLLAVPFNLQAQLPDTLWTRYIDWGDCGQECGDHLWDSEVTADGNWLASGRVGSYDGLLAALMKFTPNGDTLWTRPEGAFEFDLLPDGSIVGAALGLRYFTADGNLVWQHPLAAGAYSCAMASDGGFGILSGWDYSGPPLSVTKFTSSGDSLLTYQESDPVNNGCGGIAAGNDGGLVVYYTRNLGAFNRHLMVLGLTAEGAEDWSHDYWNSLWGGLPNVFRTPQGNYVFAASHSQAPGVTWVKMMCVSGEGTPVYNREFAAPSGIGAAVGTADGGLMAVIGDRTLMRFDRQGDSLWTQPFPMPAMLEMWSISTIAPDSCGGFFVGGVARLPNLPPTDSMHVAIGRLSPEPPIVLDSVSGSLEGDHIVIHGFTRWEFRSAMIECWRSVSPDDEFSLIATLPAVEDNPDGATYAFQDNDIPIGPTYWYFIGATNLCEHHFEFRNAMISVVTTGVNNDRAPIVRETFLTGYPNPFNSTTQLRFELSKPSHVELSIINTLGQRVAMLANEDYAAGSQAVFWDASGVASGVYFAQLRAGDQSRVVKLVLMK